MKSKVYFTSKITPDMMIEMYKQLGVELKGNVAVKLHSGEVGNQNFLRPEFMRPIVKHVKGTIVECNTAYKGERNTTEKHKKTIEYHGWSGIGSVDIMDEDGDLVLPVKNGIHLDVNYVGKNIEKYDSLLVLSHFKGHPMGGFGGALKNISIGIASAYGKAYIHGVKVPENIWSADHDAFIESMADAASTIHDMYKGKVAYINVMCNMSVDCDCCAKAEDPCMNDIGILASLDPLALDQACVDLVYASKDKGRDHMIERIESRNGTLILDAAKRLNIGSREYELINID